MSRTLRQLQDDCEAVSRFYAGNFQIDRNEDWYLLKLQEETGELASAYLRITGRGRAKGETDVAIRQQFEDELADCLAQIFLIAEHFDVDLESAIDSKWLKYLPAAHKAG